MGTGHEKAQAMVRNLKLSALTFQEGGWVGDSVNDQSCLYDEASTKKSQVHGTKNFWVGEHNCMLGD